MQQTGDDEMAVVSRFNPLRNINPCRILRPTIVTNSVVLEIVVKGVAASEHSIVLRAKSTETLSQSHERSKNATKSFGTETCQLVGCQSVIAFH